MRRTPSTAAAAARRTSTTPSTWAISAGTTAPMATGRVRSRACGRATSSSTARAGPASRCTSAGGLEAARAVFGRAEAVAVGDRELAILLVKNPAGANEVLRTLALDPGRHDVFAVLNDRTADGHDVSWVWDADFELVADRVRRVTCSGTRAAELAVRLKYAGVPVDRLHVVPPLADGLDAA